MCSDSEQPNCDLSSLRRYWKPRPPPPREPECAPNNTAVKSSTYDLQPRCRVPCHTCLHTREMHPGSRDLRPGPRVEANERGGVSERGKAQSSTAPRSQDPKETLNLQPKKKKKKKSVTDQTRIRCEPPTSRSNGTEDRGRSLAASRCSSSQISPGTRPPSSGFRTTRRLRFGPRLSFASALTRSWRGRRGVDGGVVFTADPETEVFYIQIR